jgi:hypothetical protein
MWGTMLIEKDISKILNQLASGDSIRVAFDDTDITIRFVDGGTKLSLTALVFDGGNYIPSSIRSCLSLKSPFPHTSLLTYLSLDEQHFQVRLNYLGHTETITQTYFKEILEEFGWIAAQWRTYLNERGKNDLIYVRVR